MSVCPSTETSEGGGFNDIDFSGLLLFSIQHLLIHIIPSWDWCPQCACPLPPAPLLDAARRETMLEEEGRLARLHPRAAVRSLNGKALNWTGVIWTVRFWSTSSTPAAPNPNFPNPKLPWTQISSFYVSISLAVECRFTSEDATAHLSSLSHFC